jgi:hypothetical protein
MYQDYLKPGSIVLRIAKRLAQDRTDPFYSHLVYVVQNLPQEIMTVAQAKAAIMKNVKQDEINLSGILTDPLSPLLGKATNSKITKKDLLNYVTEHQSTLEDVTFNEKEPSYVIRDSGGWESEDYKTREEAQVALEEAARDLAYDDPGFYLKKGPWITEWVVKNNDGDKVFISRDEQDAKVFMQRNDMDVDEKDENGNSPSLREEYSPEREWYGKDSDGSIVETFDSEDEANEWLEAKIEEAAKMLEEDMRIIENTSEEEAGKFPEYQLPGKIKPGTYLEKFVTWPNATTQNWEDGHADYSAVNNPVVRIRRNIRTDANGKKHYFIEEMQGPSEEEQAKMPPEVRKRIYDIGMKKAFTDAADEGADALTWTTGQHQVQRYKDAIVKQVDHINWVSGPNGKLVGIFTKSKSQEINVLVNGEGVVTKSLANGETLVGKRLDAIIGKPMAEKIINDASGSTPAEGIEIGGEGLRDLYDRKLPNIANNIVGKTGSKVGNATLNTPTPQPFHSVDIPQEWKQNPPSFKWARKS